MDSIELWVTRGKRFESGKWEVGGGKLSHYVDLWLAEPRDGGVGFGDERMLGRDVDEA